MLQRIGTCERCGECCANFPWPYTDASHGAWSPEDFETRWPQAKFFELPAHGGKHAGEFALHGQRISYRWTEQGLTKDVDSGDPEYGNCPFLLPEEDGERACLLVDTEDEWMFEQACKPEPPEQKVGLDVGDWKFRHPNCSYRWGIGVGSNSSN